MKPDQIKLSGKQAAWLKMIAPEMAHATYKELRKKKAPGRQDALFDNGNFGAFLRGERSCARELAETVCEAYGTTLDQLEVVRQLPIRLPSPCRGGQRQASAEKAADQFFKSCGDFLWKETQKDKQQPSSVPAGITEDALLDLLGWTLEKKTFLTNRQKLVIFGELLDYLLETRQYGRWGKWMISLSHENNRNMFREIRLQHSKGSVFPGSTRDPNGQLHFDQAELEKLSKTQLDDYAFFVRRLNMYINQLRHENFARREHAFAELAEHGGVPPKLSPVLDAIQAKGKVPVRNYFRWALDNVKPFLEAVRRTKNPHRWYFLMCATRLMYDWARWHYYSVLDEDKRAACDMYHDIRDLAEKCRLNSSVEVTIKCRFAYMAATACRYMAEGASAGIWGRQKEAAGYVVEAVDFARYAMDVWKSEKSDAETGEYKALNYRFTRNYARIATFAARWWLLHPTKSGERPFMPEQDNLDPKRYGIILLRGRKERKKKELKELTGATEYCQQTICSPLRADESAATCPMVLEGKRLLEYEFHLRVCLEMLVYFFSNDTEGAPKIDDSDSEDIQKAMSIFCRMVVIYTYLFLAGFRGNSKKKWMTLAEDAKLWLKRHDHYFDVQTEENPFDISVLDKTVQGSPPSLSETRFETVCSFMYSIGIGAQPSINVLWGFLSELSRKIQVEGLVEFLDKVWGPAKKALEADLKESVKIAESDTEAFSKTNGTSKLRKEHWKDYPPFRFRNALVNAPGNNPEYVACLMRQFGLRWDAVKKEAGK